MKIDVAIEFMRRGRKVARTGWNGKGMYLYLVPASASRREYVEMRDATGLFVPWLCSQTDLLADDWDAVD